MARSAKPEHVAVALKPAKKLGNVPDPNSGIQKVKRRRAEIDAKRELQGLPKKQRRSHVSD